MMRRRDLFMTAAATVTGAMAAGTAPGLNAASTKQTPSRVDTLPRPHLRVRDWGEGAPIVFLSGWALPSDYWQYHMADLTAQGMRCVAYDRRGHGRSDDPGTGYDYDTLADDLASVLDRLNLTNVTLIAYSMGGGEAARYVKRHGSARLARMVFVSATTPFLTRTATNADGVPAEMFDGLRQLLVRDFPKWVADGEATYWLNLVSPEMQAWGRSLVLQASLPALLECNKAMVSTDFRPDLQALKLATLVIHGDKDVSAPLALTGAKTARLVPNARFILYEGAAHGLPLTHRDRFNKDLLAFVANQG